MGYFKLFNSNGFCKISGFIDIAALERRDIVSKQLQRNDGHQRNGDIGAFRDADDMVRDRAGLDVVIVDYSDDFRSPCLDFLDV